VTQIELTRVDPHHTAVVRDRVAPAQLTVFVPAACGEAWAFVRSAGSPAPGRNLAVYLDAEGAVECGVEVSAPFTGNGRVVCSRTPGGLVATATHWGPYGLLGGAHRAIRQWCTQHGHQITGISWELYGHWMPEWNEDPSKIRTDICYLLQRDTG
jgi:effector-binding domain-containing protein